MIAVIGDVHGCYSTLESLYAQIVKYYPGINFYCVGDLVDRGNGSYQVMEFFIKNNVKFTPGNHDLMFYDSFKKPESIFAKSWANNGSDKTILSYMNNSDSINFHLEVISRAPTYYNLDDCFICHAGISVKYEKILPPNFRDNLERLGMLIHAEIENESGVMWTRDRLLNLGKLQIVGHTIQKEIKFDNKANAVYIDTGACAGNKLSAIIVDKSSIIETFSEITHKEDI